MHAMRWCCVHKWCDGANFVPATTDAQPNAKPNAHSDIGANAGPDGLAHTRADGSSYGHAHAIADATTYAGADGLPDAGADAPPHRGGGAAERHGVRAHRGRQDAAGDRGGRLHGRRQARRVRGGRQGGGRAPLTGALRRAQPLRHARADAGAHACWWKLRTTSW